MYIIKHVVSVVLLCIFFICFSHAGTWVDQFIDVELNGWERIFEDNPWFAEWEVSPFTIGRLLGIITKPEQDQLTAADFLHWNARKFQLEKVTVVGEEMRYVRVAHIAFPETSGELCLFLGKRQSSPNFAKGYIFSPETTTRMQFSSDGFFKRGEVKADYGLMFRLTSGNLRVTFESGKFQLWTQDLLITEFFDVEIPVIDVVGLMIVHNRPGNWFDGTISSFSISGEGIPNYGSLNVQLQGTQLTTTWGKLKQF